MYGPFQKGVGQRLNWQPGTYDVFGSGWDESEFLPMGHPYAFTATAELFPWSCHFTFCVPINK